MKTLKEDVLENSKLDHVPNPVTEPFEAIITETPDGVVYRKLAYFRPNQPSEPPIGVRKLNVLG